jgi:hypothetical protein
MYLFLVKEQKSVCGDQAKNIFFFFNLYELDHLNVYLHYLSLNSLDFNLHDHLKNIFKT